MMRDNRERLGLSVARATWLLGMSVLRYRELEEGEKHASHDEGVRWSFRVTDDIRVPILRFDLLHVPCEGRVAGARRT